MNWSLHKIIHIRVVTKEESGIMGQHPNGMEILVADVALPTSWPTIKFPTSSLESVINVLML